MDTQPRSDIGRVAGRWYACSGECDVQWKVTTSGTPDPCWVCGVPGAPSMGPKWTAAGTWRGQAATYPSAGGGR